MRKLIGILGFVALLLSWTDVHGQRALVADDYSFAPNVFFDAASGRLRLWYNHRSDGTFSFVHRDSIDGLTWSPPKVLRSSPDNAAAWGAGVVDTGENGSERFRNAYYWIGPGANGFYVATSSDGLVWKGPADHEQPVLTPTDDRLDPWRNALTGQYGLFIKKMNGDLRETWVSHSKDFVNWSEPTRAFWADGYDEGETQFYGAACCLARDGLLIAFLRVLRDDVMRGIGYTVLAWSRDGRHWSRSRTPFLDRCRGTFDDAIAWIYGVTERHGTIYLAYAGYEHGHKVGNRVVAVATMPSVDLSISDDEGPDCERLDADRRVPSLAPQMKH